MNELNTLFPITTENVNDFCVDLRKLHEWLEVKSRFNDWIANRLKEYDFKDKYDFYYFFSTGNHGGSPTKNYLATIDMAKELAMVERNEKGKEVRRYFIEVERRFKEGQTQSLPQNSARWIDANATMRNAMELAELVGIPKHIAITETGKEIYASIGLDLRPMLAHSKYMDDIKDDEMMLEPTELAKALGIKSGVAMNKLLTAVGLQERGPDGWTPTNAGEMICFRHGWTKNGKSGYNLKWNVEAVKKALDDESYENDNLVPFYPND